MKRSAVLAAAVAGIAGLGSVAGAQEIETFDSPNETQNGGGNFAFANPIQGSWLGSNGGSITDNPTNITITTNATPPKNAYGTAYHNLFTQDTPGTLDISQSNMLQLDVTINSGQAGLIVDLQDGEGDYWQWYYGYGLIGSGNAAPQYPGETIKELGNNELILDMPLSMPTLNNGTPFDFTQTVLFRLEDDPGTSLVNSISFNDLSAVFVAQPLTWNNTGGTGDGVTWDIGTNQNWNNGSPTTYTDGSGVTFNDTNNGHYNVTLNTTVNPSSVTFNNSTGNYVISGTGGIAGTGSLTKMGSDMVTLSTVNTYSGGTTVSAGKLIIGIAGALPAHSSVSITGGSLQLASGTGGETLSSLSITAGTLDIVNNHVILSYAAGTQAATDTSIRGYLISGRNGGTWAGTTGITSSAAATNSHYAIGYADGADHVVAGLSSGQIEIKYTLLGDADLDGAVTGSDFTALVGNLGKSGRSWDQGDFDYDGSVTGSDFTALVGNLGKSATGADVVLPAADYAAIDAFAAANGLMADVPEPATIGLMVLGGIGALGRRRRKA
jgi:autotransporter-associated beta strand protein